MNKIILMVGGPVDGRRMSIDKDAIMRNKYIVWPERVDFFSNDPAAYEDSLIEPRHHHYILQKVFAEGNDVNGDPQYHYFYLHTSIGDVFSLLLQRYNHEVKQIPHTQCGCAACIYTTGFNDARHGGVYKPKEKV